jgi:hypothetical protein
MYYLAFFANDFGWGQARDRRHLALITPGAHNVRPTVALVERLQRGAPLAGREMQKGQGAITEELFCYRFGGDHMVTKRVPFLVPSTRTPRNLALRERLMFYEIALRCAAGDDPRITFRQVVAQHVIPTPTEIRRVRQRYKSFARMYGPVAHEYLCTEPYNRNRHSDAPIGTKARVQANSPDWDHASRNGWFAVKDWTGGEWTIERYLFRILTPRARRFA